MGAMDLVRGKDQGSAASSSSSSSQRPCEDVEMNKKCCVDCKATKTPLWRSGPAGPKSLCNACGIRHRKRRVSMGLSKEPQKKKETASPQAEAEENEIEVENENENEVEVENENENENGGSTCGEGSLSESMKMNLVALGKDLMTRGSPAKKKQRCRRRRREMGEEEQAAVCLLAMSCGHVFA